MVIVLMVIDAYSIYAYWCILVHILLMIINAYSIDGYWCLFY
jgi:hypothetical protein